MDELETWIYGGSNDQINISLQDCIQNLLFLRCNGLTALDCSIVDHMSHIQQALIVPKQCLVQLLCLFMYRYLGAATYIRLDGKAQLISKYTTSTVSRDSFPKQKFTPLIMIYDV